MLKYYLRGLAGKCPNCGNGRMSKGIIGLHEKCDSCGLVYEDDPGDFMGAMVIVYTVGVFAATGAGLALHYVFGMGTGLALLCTAIAAMILIPATYRPLKGIWIALLVHLGGLPPPEYLPEVVNRKDN